MKTPKTMATMACIASLATILNLPPIAGPVEAAASSPKTTGQAISNPLDSSHTVAIRYIDYDKAGQVVGKFGTLAKAKQFLDPYPGGWVKDKSTGTIIYQMPDFTTVDLRYPAPSDVTAGAINRFFRDHASPLAGLGATFIAAQKKYGVDATYLVAHAIEESNWGKSPMAISKDNLYGTGAFTADPNLAGQFPSFEYAIRYQAWVVRKDYLNPNYSHYVAPTLAGMSQNYASDKEWANNIRAIMNQLAVFLGDSVKSYRQFQAELPDVSPIIMIEPTYDLNGATAKVLSDKYYAGAPVYPSIGDGQLQQFSRPLKLGDTGDDVTTLQTMLNTSTGSSDKADGVFGPETEDELKSFQTSLGLRATGVCDYSLWTGQLGVQMPKLLTTGRVVSIDEEAQGMIGAHVVTWFHVRSQGWVNAHDMELNNVYRVLSKPPTNPTRVLIPVYATGTTSRVIATLHSGDTVVCGKLDGKHIVIHFVNQNTGKPLVGWITSQQVRLKALR